MKKHSKKSLALSAILLTLILSSTGCQSFNMTQAEFQRQQAGKDVDPAVGSAVGAVGSAAYFGSTLGAFLAGVK